MLFIMIDFYSLIEIEFKIFFGWVIWNDNCNDKNGICKYKRYFDSLIFIGWKKFVW